MADAVLFVSTSATNKVRGLYNDFRTVTELRVTQNGDFCDNTGHCRFSFGGVAADEITGRACKTTMYSVGECVLEQLGKETGCRYRVPFRRYEASKTRLERFSAFSSISGDRCVCLGIWWSAVDETSQVDASPRDLQRLAPTLFRISAGFGVTGRGSRFSSLRSRAKTARLATAISRRRYEIDEFCRRSLVLRDTLYNFRQRKVCCISNGNRAIGGQSS